MFQSGQMGQTVNLLRQRFGGSNPSAPTKQLCIVVAAPKGKWEILCKSSKSSLLQLDEAKISEFFFQKNAEVLRKLSESSLLQLNAAKTLAKTLKGDLRK